MTWRKQAFLSVIVIGIVLSISLSMASTSKKKSLAIFNFRPTNIEAMGYNSDILYTLSSALGMEGSIELLPRRTMEEMLYQGGLSQSDNEDMAFKAGKALGVNFVLFGQVTKQGADILSIINLLDIQNKRIIKTWPLTFSGREAISEKIPAFAKEMMNYIKQAEHYTPTDASAQLNDIDIESLSAVSEGNSVIITWKFDPSKPISAFNIYRSETEDGPFQSIGRSNKNNHHDATIQKGRTYYYRVGILLHSGTENKSRHVALVRNAGEKLPHPPLMISCKGFIRRAELKFVPSLQNEKEKFNIIVYEVHRSEAPFTKTEIVMTIENRSRSRYDLSFSVEDTKDLKDGQEYRYSISSVDNHQRKSPLSEPFLITTVQRPKLRLVQDNLLRKIELAWDPLNNVDGYTLYRAIEGGSWEVVEKIRGAEKFNYADVKNLTDQKEYQYYLSAFDGKGETGPSHIIKGKTKDLPSYPRDFVAKNGMVKSVWVSWAPIDDPDIGGYAVYRGKTNRGLELVVKVKGYTSLSYLDKGTAFAPLEDGTEYYYSVTSYNLHGVEGVASEAIKANTKPVPASVKGLTITITEANNILIRWEQNSESDITGYVLLRNRNDGYWSKLQTLMPSQTSYRDYDLKPDTVYRYRVVAEDKDNLKSDPTDSDPIPSPIIGRK